MSLSNASRRIEALENMEINRPDPMIQARESIGKICKVVGREPATGEALDRLAVKLLPDNLDRTLTDMYEYIPLLPFDAELDPLEEYMKLAIMGPESASNQ